MYATTDDYINIFLLGRAEIIPLAEFPFWSRQASVYIDLITFNRITDFPICNAVILATCDLAEAMYMNGSINATREISSESVGGFSVSYEKRQTEQTQDAQYRDIVTMHLGNTGLLFRGVR